MTRALGMNCAVAVFPFPPPQAISRAGLHQSDIDYWEINQAFSVVDLVNQQLLGLEPHR
jgi:acetyl-CoA acetyltransferase